MECMLLSARSFTSHSPVLCLALWWDSRKWQESNLPRFKNSPYLQQATLSEKTNYFNHITTWRARYYYFSRWKKRPREASLPKCNNYEVQGLISTPLDWPLPGSQSLWHQVQRPSRWQEEVTGQTIISPRRV